MALTREIIQPKNPALNVSRNLKLPHSPGIRAGDFIYLSGMVSIDPDTGKRSPGSLEHEVRMVLTNMGHMLESAGSSLSRVVKINVMLVDMLLFDNMNDVYREFFPVNPPARTTCGVQLSSGLKVEIEAIALHGTD
jgi:2-iminobutanoate/2-iminopropanoate deaminase